MKLVSVLLGNFDVKQVGEKKTNKFVFYGMETDLNGARIPIELQTFNEDIKNKLMQYCNTKDELLIPFSNFNQFAGKYQYNIDSIITHPDFIILSQI